MVSGLIFRTGCRNVKSMVRFHERGFRGILIGWNFNMTDLTCTRYIGTQIKSKNVQMGELWDSLICVNFIHGIFSFLSWYSTSPPDEMERTNTHNSSYTSTSAKIDFISINGPFDPHKLLTSPSMDYNFVHVDISNYLNFSHHTFTVIFSCQREKKSLCQHGGILKDPGQNYKSNKHLLLCSKDKTVLLHHKNWTYWGKE